MFILDLFLSKENIAQNLKNGQCMKKQWFAYSVLP